MDIIEASYRIVTPMFCCGADREQAELRAQSVKGMLRFWYRACLLSKYKKWQEVQKQERYLFGDRKTGQGIFLLRLDTRKNSHDVSRCELMTPGCQYLGYGPIFHVKKEPAKELYLNEGSRFTLKLIFRPQRKADVDNHIEDLCLSLKAWGMLGGMGSRSRRGFGSVALETLKRNGVEFWSQPKNVKDLEKELQELTDKVSLLPELPVYTAFSKHTQIALIMLNKEKSLEALDEIGKEMIRYRSYGRFDKTKKNRQLPWGEEQKECNFQEDHDWMYRVKDGSQEKSLPQRIVFGLPLSHGKKGVTVGGNTRRSSPLLIHIQPCGNEHLAVLTLLPAVFYANKNASIRVTKKINDKTIEMDYGNEIKTSVDYGVIETFLERFRNRVVFRGKEVVK